MRKLLLNLVPGEPLALVQELARIENPIQLDLLLASVLDFHFHDTICGGLFHVDVIYSAISEMSYRGGK